MIYLDCDGVLADFDRRATEVLGMTPVEFEATYGDEEFWRVISGTPDFFTHMHPMAGAFELYEAVRHTTPVILTGIPRGTWAEPQKRQWAKQHFPEVEVITCFAAQKSKYRKPGDVLIDDRTKYRDRWEKNGGIFIHHQTAAQSIGKLKDSGLI